MTHRDDTYRIADIAAAIGARVSGDPDLRVRGLRHPAEAGPDDLAMAGDAAHVAALTRGRARAAVLSEEADWRELGLKAAIHVRRPRAALAGLTRAMDAAPRPAPGIHPSAIISPSAWLGNDIAVGPFCVIEAGARIGAGSQLLAHVHVGDEAEIGAGALIQPGVRIGHGVRIGDRAIIHANAVIGADGFSFVTPQRGAVESARATGAVAEDARNTRLDRIHSLGAVWIGDDVEIGACTTIDRGTLADTRIGSGTKIDNQVQIGHNVRIGENCMICAQAGVAGSTVIGDRVVLGGKVGIADHVRIGDDVIAGAHAGVGTDLPSGSVVLGSPAVPRNEALAIMLAWRRLPKLVTQVREMARRLDRGGD
ncbi:MAG: UDP-3-O-(3-hydroxymyristoyl)glucosamine N-acyltransferase [Rubrimonas sp.]